MLKHSGSKEWIIPPRTGVTTDLLLPTSIEAHKNQSPVGSAPDVGFLYGIETGGWVVGSKAYVASESGIENLLVELILQNRSPAARYYLTDGGDHPFDFILVTPCKKAFALQVPLRERQLEWRRETALSIAPGNEVRFVFRLPLAGAVNREGEYLFYAVARIPKGRLQPEAEVVSETSALQISAERAGLIRASAGDLGVSARWLPKELLSSPVSALDSSRVGRDLKVIKSSPAARLPEADVHSTRRYIIGGLVGIIGAVAIWMFYRRKVPASKVVM